MTAAEDAVTRRPGRPPEGARVPVRLPRAVLAEIDRRARLLGRSRAAVIRSLLAEVLGLAEAPDDGVDRAQIRRALARSPADRVRHMVDVTKQQGELRGRARRR